MATDCGCQCADVPFGFSYFLSDVIRIPKNKLFKEGGGFILTDRECRVYHHREAMMTEA